MGIKYILFTLALSFVFYISPGECAKRKVVRESSRRGGPVRGGKGTRSKAQKKQDKKQRAKDKQKAIDEIVPYKKSLTTGKIISEKESRERRFFSKSRKRLLKLLKEKIDKNRMNKSAKNFTKSEIKLLRKLDEYKKSIDSEEKELQTLKANRTKKLDELNKLVTDAGTKRVEITKLLEKKKTKDEEKILRLVKILEAVKAQQLAKLLETMDQDLFVIVAEKLKPKTLANALKFMSKEKAIKLNEKFLAKDF